MAFSLSRHVVIFPAWVWVMLSPCLALAVYFMGAPDELAEPAERADLFNPPILVTRSGDALRYVPMDEHQGVTPLWSMNCQTTAVTGLQRVLPWVNETIFGFWKRSGQWRYALIAGRFDPEGKTGVDGFAPTSDELARFRVMLVDELNRRSHSQKGDRLAQLLDNGLERSSYFCVENLVVLLVWLSLPMALFGLVAMVVEPGGGGRRKDAKEAAEIRVAKR
jgi:hypothetical protein